MEWLQVIAALLVALVAVALASSWTGRIASGRSER